MCPVRCVTYVSGRSSFTFLLYRPNESREFTLRNKVLDNEKRRRMLALSASRKRQETFAMEAAPPTQPQAFGNSPAGPFRGLLADSIRFWELRRIVYNFALAAVVVAWLVATWPHFRPALKLIPLLQFAVLALLANVCYCAAYLVDIPLLSSPLSDVWRRRRWALWLVGTLFAVLFENYWIADEIYDFVN